MRSVEEIIKDQKTHGKAILKPDFVRCWHGGISMQFFFKNGYQASVVQFDGSYGFENHKWELAILRKQKDGIYRICYHTKITNDVIGYSSLWEVQSLLLKIQKLKKGKCVDKSGWESLKK